MDDAVFIVVVLARFLVPLAIPRFPLPAVVAALVLDAVDQSVFAAFDIEPANYQGYDKALDIYYLTIAYVSTIRNWTDGVPFRVGQFLWYYRLVGVVAFELSGARFMLLVFPNTFEYFFIFYEAARLRWEPSRLSDRTVLWAAAAIWVVIKLPQEWWIHIARLDVTDVLGEQPWLWLVVVVLAAMLTLVGRQVGRRLPEPDWPWSFDVDAHATTAAREPADPQPSRWARLEHPLVEKTILVGLVATIFIQLVPDADVGIVQILGVVAVLIVANAFIGTWLTRFGTAWRSMASQFVGTGLINIVLVLFGATLTTGPSDDAGFGVGPAVFLLTLLTLIVTLYDRYRYTRILSHWLPPSPPEATA